MSMPSPRSTAAAVLLALIQAGSGSAAAQDPDPLQALCPGAEAALQHALAGVWLVVGEPGSVQVTLTVEGMRITGLATRGSGPDYRDATRKAVRQLRCTAGAGKSRQVMFELAFVGPDEGAGARRSANNAR